MNIYISMINFKILEISKLKKIDVWFLNLETMIDFIPLGWNN